MVVKCWGYIVSLPHCLFVEISYALPDWSKRLIVELAHTGGIKNHALNVTLSDWSVLDPDRLCGYVGEVSENVQYCKSFAGPDIDGLICHIASENLFDCTCEVVNVYIVAHGTTIAPYGNRLAVEQLADGNGDKALPGVYVLPWAVWIRWAQYEILQAVHPMLKADVGLNDLF